MHAYDVEAFDIIAKEDDVAVSKKKSPEHGKKEKRRINKANKQTQYRSEQRAHKYASTFYKE